MNLISLLAYDKGNNVYIGISECNFHFCDKDGDHLRGCWLFTIDNDGYSGNIAIGNRFINEYIDLNDKLGLIIMGVDEI